jgi:hypothetical protein
MKKLSIILVVLALAMFGCAGSQEGQSVTTDTKGTCYDPGVYAFGSHFKSYLNNTGNSDLTGFGGSTSITGDCAPVNEPVIFVHGNGDDAAGQYLPMGGWVTSRNYFLSKGYKPTELYAVNYGLPGAANASLNYHAPANLSKINRFILAVKNYTGKSKVDVIAHSLGVTSVRRAVKGGTYCDYTGTCVSLTALNSYIDTFVGIAGGNRGLNSCGVWPLNVWAPTCGPHGFAISNPFFQELQGGSARPSSMKVGSYTYSIKSFADELTCAPAMPTTCYIYSYHTSDLYGQNGSKTYYSAPYGHMGAKEYTASVQYNMVKDHTY